MDTIEILMIALGLSMDAFAAAVCQGLSMPRMKYKNAVIIGFFFGGFQALMPLLGYFLGSQFNKYFMAFDHWIAFTLLTVIGINMIREACESGDSCERFSLRNIAVLAFATSIDALVVGITFAFMDVNLIPSVSIIGTVTFFISIIGVKIGSVFGERFKKRAEVFGGIVLILIGLKILLEDIS